MRTQGHEPVHQAGTANVRHDTESDRADDRDHQQFGQHERNQPDQGTAQRRGNAERGCFAGRFPREAARNARDQLGCIAGQQRFALPNFYGHDAQRNAGWRNQHQPLAALPRRDAQLPEYDHGSIPR
uniref:(northern house mosquito) hypothetical protein n=1 Tax=Culex pipiens TaxID=7175 RepID=A0A8D8JV83_CULPI